MSLYDPHLIYSQGVHWNPLLANGKEIEHIQFYNANGALLYTYNDKTAIKWFGFGSNSEHKTIKLSHPIQNRRKLRFDRVEHFMVGHVLYLHTELLTDFKYEVVDVSDDLHKQKQEKISFKALSSGKNVLSSFLSSSSKALNEVLQDQGGEFAHETLVSSNYIQSEPKPLYNKLKELSNKYNIVSIVSLHNMYKDGLIKLN